MIRPAYACKHLVAALLLLTGVLLHAAPACAQNVSVTIASGANPLSVGTIIRGTASTTFTISNAGAVSKSPSGSTAAVRMTAGNTNVLSLTLRCTGNTRCNSTSRKYAITVSSGTRTGGGDIGVYSFGALSRGSLVSGTPTAADPLTFQFQNVNFSSGAVTLTLGFTFVVSSTATRGNTSVPYTVKFDYIG